MAIIVITYDSKSICRRITTYKISIPRWTLITEQVNLDHQI